MHRCMTNRNPSLFTCIKCVPSKYTSSIAVFATHILLSIKGRFQMISIAHCSRVSFSFLFKIYFKISLKFGTSQKISAVSEPKNGLKS